MDSNRLKLKVNMMGQDIKTLQIALRQIGLQIDDAEVKAQRFGKSTSHAVRQLQISQNLKPTGVVDPETAAVIRKLLNQHKQENEGPRTFTITGRVIARGSQQGIDGLRVEAWDKDQVYDDLIASAISDRRGAFRMKFDESRFREVYPEQMPDLYFKVYLGEKLVTSTEDNVLWNIKAGEIEVEIKIDLEGQTEIRPRPYSITGYVRTTERLPVPGILVEAFYKAVGKATLLGKTYSDEDGFYQIDYTEMVDSHSKSPQIDLYVQCCASDPKEKKVLAKSDLLLNASNKVNIDLIVPKEFFPSPTEFEILDQKIHELIKDSDPETLDNDDFDYLAAKLDLDVAEIKRFIHALILKQQADQFANKPKVPSAVFYMLAGDQEPPALENIVSRNTSSMLQTIQQGVDNEIIPAAIGDRVDRFVGTLKRIAVAIALEATSDTDEYSLRKLIDIHEGLPEEIKNRFIQDYTLKEGDDPEFWEKIQKSRRYKKDLPSIQTLFTLAALTRENIPLIRSLYTKSDNIAEFATWQVADWEDLLSDDSLFPQVKAEGKPTINEYARTLAQAFKQKYPMVDHVDSLTRFHVHTQSKDLEAFLERNYDFDPGKETINQYLVDSGTLALFRKELRAIRDSKKRDKRRKEQQAFMRELRQLQFVYNLAPEKNRVDCAAALKAFEIETYSYPTPPETALASTNSTDTRKKSSARKKKTPDKVLQPTRLDKNYYNKLLKLEEDPNKRTLPLSFEGIQPPITYKKKADSAISIVSINKADFKRKWEEIRLSQGGTDLAAISSEAEEIYDRARYQAFQLLQRAWSVSASLGSVSPAFTTAVPCSIPVPAFNSSTTSTPTIADLTTLFGQGNYCDCSHCQSIHGPAAYLAEIYGALSFPAQYELNCRRPDIMQLHLDCENTATQLPHIDLALELLERLVLTQPWVFGGSGIPLQSWDDLVNLWHLQTTHTQNELSLRPEYELPYVYIWLSILGYPLTLPWDKWFAEANFYLEYMGTPLSRLVETFTPAAVDSFSDEFGAYRKSQISSSQVVRALLQMPEPQYDLVARPFSGADSVETYLHWEDNLKALWNIPADSVAEVKPLLVLMKKIGLWRGNKKGENGSADFNLARRILGSRYIQDSRSASNLVIDITFDGESCDASNAIVNNLTRDTLLRLTKFEHLRRVLAWTPDELNLAIMVFSKLDLNAAASRLLIDNINPRLLTQLSHLVRIVRKRKDLSVSEVLSWWGILDTGAGIRRIKPVYEGDDIEPAEISLYEKTFLDRTLYQIQQDASNEDTERFFFELNERKTELQYLEDGASQERVCAHSGIIGGALRLDEAEVLELIQFVRNTYFNGIGGDLPLNLQTLSALYRVPSLARFCGLSIHEFILVYQLLGDELDPFKLAAADETIESETTMLFIETVEKLKQSPFTLRDLAYIWQHRTESDQEEENLHSQAQYYLDQLRPILGEAIQNIEEGSLFDSDREQVARQQLLILGQGEELTEAILSGLSSTDGSVPSYPRPVGRMIMPFLTPDQHQVLNDLYADPATVELRFDILIEYLKEPAAVMSALGQSVSSHYGLSLDTTRAVVALILRQTPQSPTSALQDFCGWINDEVEESVILGHLWRVDKIAPIVGNWKLTAKELLFFHMHAGISFNTIPIEGSPVDSPVLKPLSTLINYVTLRDRLSVKNGNLIDIFNNARSPEDIDRSGAALQQLAALLALPQDELKRMALALEYIDDVDTPKLRNGVLKTSESIWTIVELADLMRRIGCSANVIGKWVRQNSGDLGSVFSLEKSFIDASSDPSEIGMSSRYVSGLLKYKQEMVEEIRNAVKARCGESQWQEVGHGIQDTMRILQRDKLLDFIVNWPISGYCRKWKSKVDGWVVETRQIDFETFEDVYDYLLLDPLVNPCMNTTRLKQAISSTQLYIHRILMGLEGDVISDSYEDVLEKDWEWKKNYRVWEAHKKVFLYPENWIEPELRDDKTPFFKEFEGELSQSDIEEQSIEKAYKNYLSKVDEVGNLEVAAFIEETSYVNDKPASTLHVIGRTRETPRVHYYRKRNPEGLWEPWERVEIDIESEVVLLSVYLGKLYLFWPTIKESIQKLGQDNSEDSNNDKTNYRPVMEIRFNWSSYQDGRWVTKKKNDEPIVLMYDWNYVELVEKPEQLLSYRITTDEKGLSIDVGMLAKESVSINKYVWDDDMLSGIFLAVKSLPSEIDWSYIQPGADFLKQDPIIEDDTISLITDAVDLITTNAETNLRNLLYYQPKIENPFDFIRNTLVTGHEPIDMNRRGVKNEKLWKGILGFYLSSLANGVISKKDGSEIVYEAQYRNVDDWHGLDSSDLLRIDAALMDLYNLPIDPETDIELIDKGYRYLLIDDHVITGNKVILFAQVRFSGYKLKSKTTNSLGLIDVDGVATELKNAVAADGSSLPRVLNIASSDAPRLSDYKIKDFSSNSQYSYLAKFNYNQTALDYIEDHTYRTELIYRYYGRSRDYHLFCTDDLKAFLTSYGGLNFRQYFYHDFKYCYFLQHSPPEEFVYSCVTFYHPFIGDYNAILHDHTVPKISDRFDLLLRLDEQRRKLEFPLSVGDLNDIHLEQYQVDGGSWYQEANQFGFHQPFGIYNWEIFFHMPFTIAVRLSQNKKFAEAQKWFHYIFNPLASTSTADDPSGMDFASRYWNFKPLHDLGNPVEEEADQSWNYQEAELAKDPFQPHRLARIRQGAYQRAVVMKYLDNLIAWGDSLFERDTMESINEAAHLYVLALKILGLRPVRLPRQIFGEQSDTDSSLASESNVGNIWNSSPGMIAMEIAADVGAISLESINQPLPQLSDELDQFFTMQWFRGLPPEDMDEQEEAAFSVSTDTPVFCIPHNDILLSYWDTVLDRLFKIRNCMNKEGQVRELPIFEPPIDPGLLVRGRALGIDISELLSDLYAPLPPYRFRVMLQKAYEFCGDVQKLGGALLAALEKKDAEEISLLRSKHERQLLKLTESVKKQQIKELNENLKATQVSLELAEARFEYYNSRKFENQNEKQHVSKLNTANDYNIAGQILTASAAVAYAAPDFITNTVSGVTEIKVGGKMIGDLLKSSGEVLQILGRFYSHQGNMHAIQGSRERRMDDWQFQARQAQKEIKQIEKQLLAAEIRLNIAERELENQQKQQEQAEEIETFMKSKFTNQELYHWMVSQISGTYFQTYKLAVSLAKLAQKCYQFEKGDDSETFIGAAYWDNLKKGLLSGENLQFDLRRMESEYLRKNKRELEITRNISLKALDPVQLDLFRLMGKCTIRIPELLFDLDHPGHYNRRIKSLSISIPCVVGPYHSLNCSLRLIKSETRINLEDEMAPELGNSGDRIALSSGRNDSGLFEMNHNDERYLPFELRGAVSEWELEFSSPMEQFDRASIADVILHMRYTAREGTQDFRDQVNETILTTYTSASSDDSTPLFQRLDINREFPNHWHKFISSTDENDIHTLELELTREEFPYLLQPFSGINVTHISLFCRLKESIADDDSIALTIENAEGDTEVTLARLSEGATSSSAKHFCVSNLPVQNLNLPGTAVILIKGQDEIISKLKDLVVVLHYHVTM